MKSINLIALSAIVLGVSACSDVEPTIPKDYVRTVKVHTVAGQSGADVREFAGRVASADVSALSFRIGGEIVELPVQNGQQVQAGEIIARLDSRTAQSTLTNAQAQFELATAEHTRKQSLFKQRVISQSSYDQAYTTLVSARAALDIARDTLSYTVIHAPFAGVIGKVSVENHQVVGPNQVIATIQGEDVVEITIQMPESIVANVRPQGEIDGYEPSAWFTSDPNQKYPVRYKENAAEANRGSQTYDVTFTLERPENLQLLPGMSATVEIDIARITNMTGGDRFVVPITAVSRVPGDEQTYVWRLNPETNAVEKVAVELGRVTDDGIEILLGLSQGDRIASAGLSELTEGMVVTPLTKERGL